MKFFGPYFSNILHIHYYEIRIFSGLYTPFLGAELPRRIFNEHLHGPSEVKKSFFYGSQYKGQCGLHTGYSGGSALKFLFFIYCMRCMVRGYHIYPSVPQCSPERIPVSPLPERRIHLAERRILEFGISGKKEVVRCYFSALKLLFISQKLRTFLRTDMRYMQGFLRSNEPFYRIFFGGIRPVPQMVKKTRLFRIEQIFRVFRMEYDCFPVIRHYVQKIVERKVVKGVKHPACRRGHEYLESRRPFQCLLIYYIPFHAVYEAVIHHGLAGCDVFLLPEALVSVNEGIGVRHVQDTAHTSESSGKASREKILLFRVSRVSEVHMGVSSCWQYYPVSEVTGSGNVLFHFCNPSVPYPDGALYKLSSYVQPSGYSFVEFHGLQSAEVKRFFVPGRALNRKVIKCPVNSGFVIA